MADLGKKYCVNCLADVTNLRLRCTDCPDIELCPECFSAGAEIGNHRRWHGYQLFDGGRFSLWGPEAEGGWTSREEQSLLDAIEQYGFGNWVLFKLLHWIHLCDTSYIPTRVFILKCVVKVQSQSCLANVKVMFMTFMTIRFLLVPTEKLDDWALTQKNSPTQSSVLLFFLSRNNVLIICHIMCMATLHLQITAAGSHPSILEHPKRKWN